ncbi:MAG: hypothetical protein U9P73_07125 [Candidatus Cloacimonadota bacterium]|nr:hypothetical protein [Candidatus Cloacimonadota bacterium]
MKKVVFLLFVVLLTVSLNARWNITGAGARAAGMGGAFIGVADDATAVVWNPGGLTQLYRPEASIVSKYNSSKSTLEDWNNVKSNFILEFASAAIPFMDGRFVVAAAYQRPIDLFEDFTNGSTEINSTGGADTFTLGSGFQALPFLSIGIAANMWFGNYNKDCIDEYYDTYYSSDYYEYYDLYLTGEMSQKFSGFNMVFGLMANLENLEKPTPLKFGFTARTPFELKATEEASYIREYYWHDGDYGSDEIEYDDGEATNEMPLMLGFGSSYRLGDNFTLMADYETRAYGESNINGHDENLNQYRIGAEYLIVSDLAVIPFRVGYQSVPTLMADANDDAIIGSGFSCGTGLIFERFAFDSAFTFATNENDRGEYGIQKNAYLKFIFSGIIYF